MERFGSDFLVVDLILALPFSTLPELRAECKWMMLLGFPFHSFTLPASVDHGRVLLDVMQPPRTFGLRCRSSVRL